MANYTCTTCSQDTNEESVFFKDNVTPYCDPCAENL
jgi:hypothetical protein